MRHSLARSFLIESPRPQPTRSHAPLFWMFLLLTVGSMVDITVKVSIPIIPVFDAKFLGAYLWTVLIIYVLASLSLIIKELVGYSIFVTHACCTCTIDAM